MNRRKFLLASASLSLLGVPAIAAPRPFDAYLGGVWRVPRGTTLEIFPAELGLDLAATLAAIDGWSIPFDARLVIRLGDGEHVQKKTLNIQHPAGARLSIIGNRSNPALCRILWAGPEDALYVGAGAVLGMLDGVVMEHTARSTRGLGSAVLADEGGVIHCGPHVVVRNFYYGFQARASGVIRCGETESRGAGDANYFAFNGGHISAPGAKAYAARDQENGLGSGFVAEYGGTINAADAIANYNLLAGFTALSNGVIRAQNSKAEHNGKAGYYNGTGGTIVAHHAIARGNCGDGVLSLDGTGSITGRKIINDANSASARSCVQ